MKRVQQFLIALLCVSFWATAQAGLPLLNESAGVDLGNDIVLHPDHEEENKYYYFPASSELVRDQDDIPMFSYVYEGLGQPSTDPKRPHGMMSMVHRLTASRQQRAAIKAFKEKNPKAAVTIIPIHSGVVELKSDDGKPALRQAFLEFNFPKHGPNSDGEVGINAVLNYFGAKIMRASILKNGNSFLTTHYCFSYKGFGPMMDATIKVKMDRVYDHFKASASGGWGWFRADIATEIEKLKDIRTVDWVINGGDATDREMVEEVTKQIIRRMFKPELKAVPGSGAKSRGSQVFSFSASHTRREELKEEKWTVKQREIISQERCTHLSFDDVRPYRDELVIDADAYDGMSAAEFKL